MTAGTAPLRRWLTLNELCAWLNITERHARKLVARDAIPYRKVGRLLRFTPAEIEEWSKPAPRPIVDAAPLLPSAVPAIRPTPRRVALLPKSLIEYDTVEDDVNATLRSA
jgi:excisionase family DNA binding protein